jgi:uncharacterized protein YfaS (alpha-2-macroglobulin family)
MNMRGVPGFGGIFLLCLGAFLSCDSGPSGSGDLREQSRNFIREISPGGSSGDITETASAAAVEAAFTLDYRPQRPEPESSAGTLSAAALGGSAAAGGGEGPRIIPGLRKLEDYRTRYFNPREEGERIRAIEEARAVSGSLPVPEGRGEEALTVVDWGPQGLFSSAVRRPSIFVIFSQPMVPLASLGQPAALSPVVSISPALKGTFRWYGTSFLSFEAEEPCQSQRIYTITVDPSAASIYGQRISGETRFSFETETLSFKYVIPGEEFKKRTRWYFPDNEVPPEAARQITLTFNYPVVLEDIAPFVEIATRSGGVKAFTLTQTAPDTLLADLGDPVEFETELRVTLKAGAKSGGTGRTDDAGESALGTRADQVRSFRTPGPFRVDEFRRVPSYGKYLNLTEIRFSHRLNEASVPGNIRTDPPMGLTADNIEIAGRTVRLYNLPVTYEDAFTVFADAGLEDVYGRKLISPSGGLIRLPPPPAPQGEAYFLNYYNNAHEMLEARFDPRYLFGYKNIAPGSWYEVAAQNNPYGLGQTKSQRTNLVPGEANSRYFEEIDLKPFLNSLGKGFISFKAHMELLTNTRIKDSADYEIDTLDRNFSLQVTDLGLSVRYGFNKTAVLVTSLTTGEPVEGAAVRLIAPRALQEEDPEDVSTAEYFGEGKTDAKGLAVISTAAGLLREQTREGSPPYYYYNHPFVFAEKDGDRAVFRPDSHNVWAQGIQSAVPQRAEEITVTTFLFSDRGLYKPGEVLTFRGVDRTLVLGMYTIYTGGYRVTLEEDRYQGETLLEISGTASESGGFYGSLAIPDDAVPGSYRLTYRRDGRERDSANIPVTVAFFERLKFQASVTPPALAVISGEDINAALRASYLSGGSLSGSAYESSWYRELTRFSPQGAETRNFLFGPRNVYDAKRNISSGGGMLSADGAASISQKTGDASVEGAPYLYSVEARVTDISNQMIAASASVMVHPGRFYIGLAPAGSRGFARLGEELSFDYITVDPDGVRLTSAAPFLSGEKGSLKAELIREEWRRVQQQGVGGYIYDEYLREPVTDSSQELSLQFGGRVRVKPSQAGLYILRLSSADRDGRRVLTEYSFYVTGGRGGYWNMNNPAELRLTPDQDIYKPGDTAQVLLQSVLPSGWYLITVEREGIFTEEVRYFEDSVSVFEVPVARNYVPVVYVSISSYSVRSGPPTHEYGSPDLDKPKGYFGVTRLVVDPRVRAFSVKAESDKKTYRPGEEVTMTLTAEQDGKPLANAELTLMAVDRGVLDLINYHVPDPVRHFYNESLFPLSVRGGDSRAWLMDPVTYNVKNLAGGDAEGESKLEERKDFNPTAVFEPMLVTDRNGRVTCTFKLPDSLTTYRITVFGVRGDLFSLKETELAAQNRINVREVLPRRLRERDTAEAGVLITNLDAVSHRITVALSIGEPRQELNNPSGRIKRPGAALVDGPGEHSLTVGSGENAVVYFDVAALREGSVSLNFAITSDILNERLVQELVIEKPYVKETVTTLGIIDQNSGSAVEGILIPSFADDGAGSVTVSLDATRLGLLDAAVDYLFRYPYGCLEQRSAAVMPLVIFGEYLDVFSLGGEVSDPRAVAANEIRDWARFQRPDGGFPYWPSGLESNFYVSLRIGHIYAIAQSKGIPLPASLNTDKLYGYLDGEYQKLQSRREYYPRSYLQAYMLYVLSLLNRNVDASRLAEILGRSDADPAVMAFAGMSYRNIGRSGEAAAAAERLRGLLRPTARGADLTDPSGQPWYAYYGGPVEQLALTLEFFSAQFPGDAINTRLLFSLLEKKRAGGFWNNTAVTVRVLQAADAFIRSENLADTDLAGSVSLAGEELLGGAFRGLAAKPLVRGFDFTGEPLAGLSRDTLLPLRFSREGTGSLAYTASLTYAIPPELQFFRDEGLGVFMTLEDVLTGEETGGTALVSGRTYRARVRVSSGRDRTYLALRVPVPSGAEILDAAFAVTAGYGETSRQTGGGRSRVSHQTILDNEIQYFWDDFYKGESTVEFLFRTARRGVFPTPPVQAECMYEPEIFGRSGGALYTIE